MPTFFGQKVDGKVAWKNERGLKDYFKKLPNCKLVMEIKRWRKPRSTQQNALYWMWLEIISKDTGYTKDELHATFRAMFLTDHSKKLPVVRSTTALNKNEFATYLKKVEKEAMDLGISLPDPNEYWDNIDRQVWGN